MLVSAEGDDVVVARDLRVVRVAVGGRYFPWNYRRRRESHGRVTCCVFEGDRGHHIFNALDARGRIVGSADVRLGPRASERMIETEEFAYGGGNGSRGPYLWPDDDDTYIAVLCGLWTRPAARRQGVARLLVAAVGEFGLPVYVAFASSHMERWFDADLRPDDDCDFGAWQEAMLTFEMFAEDPRPCATRGGRYRWELACTATRHIASSELYDCVSPSLGDLLFSPVRATWSELDGGCGESGLTDTGFADDRRFGYELTIDSRVDADLQLELDDADDDEYDAALDEEVTLTAKGALQVTDADVLLDYARFRRMLRTGISDPPQPETEAQAVHELLVQAQQQEFDHVVDFMVHVIPHPATG